MLKNNFDQLGSRSDTRVIHIKVIRINTFSKYIYTEATLVGVTIEEKN